MIIEVHNSAIILYRYLGLVTTGNRFDLDRSAAFTLTSSLASSQFDTLVYWWLLFWVTKAL